MPPTSGTSVPPGVTVAGPVGPGCRPSQAPAARTRHSAMARQVRARCFILLLFSTTSCHQVLGCRRTCRDADALLALQPRRIEHRRLLDQIGRHRGVIAHFAWQVRVGAVPSAHHQHQIRDGGRASHGRALIASADLICQTATGGGFRLPSIKFRELQRDNAGKREYPGLLRSSTIKFDSDPKRARGRMPHVRQLVRGAFPISRSRAHTHRRHGHPLQTVPSAGLIERPQEKNRVDALR